MVEFIFVVSWGVFGKVVFELAVFRISCVWDLYKEIVLFVRLMN